MALHSNQGKIEGMTKPVDLNGVQSKSGINFYSNKASWKICAKSFISIWMPFMHRSKASWSKASSCRYLFTSSALAAASYPAREFGLRSAMSKQENYALKLLLSNLILKNSLGSNPFNLSAVYSSDWTLDEAYLDVTENLKQIASKWLCIFGKIFLD